MWNPPYSSNFRHRPQPTYFFILSALTIYFFFNLERGRFLLWLHSGFLWSWLWHDALYEQLMLYGARYILLSTASLFRPRLLQRYNPKLHLWRKLFWRQVRDNRRMRHFRVSKRRSLQASVKSLNFGRILNKLNLRFLQLGFSTHIFHTLVFNSNFLTTRTRNFT